MGHLKTIFSINGFHARIFISLLYFEKKCHFKFCFKVLRKFIIQGLYCSEVHPDSFVDLQAISTLRLPHPYMIIIHRSASIAHNCTIFHECTIGVIEKDDQPNKAATLKDDVYLGCKSTILGDVTIEKGSKVGACTLVLKDVPAYQVVTALWK
jgi:serine O-acetyltransferase